jgi:hypothetical protein
VVASNGDTVAVEPGLNRVDARTRSRIDDSVPSARHVVMPACAGKIPRVTRLTQVLAYVRLAGFAGRRAQIVVRAHAPSRRAVRRSTKLAAAAALVAGMVAWSTSVPLLLPVLMIWGVRAAIRR